MMHEMQFVMSDLFGVPILLLYFGRVSIRSNCFIALECFLLPICYLSLHTV